jgi:hypothetical protein
MRGLSFIAKRAKLNARGIAHFVAPLAIVVAVGLIGTFMLVASNANSLSRKGYIVVYSDKGTYDSVKINLYGADKTKHRCGGTWNASGEVIKNLPGAKKASDKSNFPPTSPISCTPIGGNAAYEITFGKNRDFTNGPLVRIDVDKGYCTLVFAAANKIDKVQYKNGCPTNKRDVPTPVDSSVRLLPATNKAKTNLTGFVEFALPGQNVTRAQCTGVVNLKTSHESSAPKTLQLPLKYVGENKSKKIKSYCVAKIHLGTAKLKAGTYKIVADFPGNPYFNPVFTQPQYINVANGTK